MKVRGRACRRRRSGRVCVSHVGFSLPQCPRNKVESVLQYLHLPGALEKGGKSLMSCYIFYKERIRSHACRGTLSVPRRIPLTDELDACRVIGEHCTNLTLE